MSEPYRPPLAAELARRVYGNLADNRLTQAMLARRVGVTEKHVSRVLLGRDDGSVPFWDAMLRESAYPRRDDEPGNRRSLEPHSCGTWPFPSSDLDLVLPEDNAKAHLARGCCVASQPEPSYASVTETATSASSSESS